MSKLAASTRKPSVRGRIQAAEALIRVSDEGAFVGLSNRGRALDPAVGRAVTHYVAGVTRWRRWLDFVLSRAYRGDFRSLEPRMRELLRIGAYDLLVDGVAPHAAVSEAVEAARVWIRPGAGKLANAVLRAVASKPELQDMETADPVERAAVRASHPSWMTRRWVNRYGQEAAERLLAHNNRIPRHGVRLVGDEDDRTGLREWLAEHHVASEPSPYLDDYVRLERLQPVVAGGLLEEGRLAVQDESAGLVVRLLDPRPGDTVADACAAPGGKTRYIAERMAGSGTIHAIESNARRARLIPTDGPTPVSVHAVELEAWDGAGGCDRVLLDVPCSGLGVLARRPDLRWRRGPDDITGVTALQDRLLDAAARQVVSGGLLVYATCTIEPEENEERVASFLARNDSFTVESASGFVPDNLVTPEGFYAAVPQEHGIDGAFGVRLRKR